MEIDRIDHIAIAVKDPELTRDFYSKVLGLQVLTFENGRSALQVGQQKINLNHVTEQSDPRPAAPTSGSDHLCFITDTPLDEVTRHLQKHGVAIELGPVPRTGALGDLSSIYFRDPDGNLIEVSVYVSN